MTKMLSLTQLQRVRDGYDWDGPNFTKADPMMAITFKRMLDEAEHAERAAALTLKLRAMLDELDADEAAERQAYYASLIVQASTTLEARDDYFIIGDPATFSRAEFELSDEAHPNEREKLKFPGHGFVGCYWVPRDVAEDALKRVPSGKFCEFQFASTPGDLLGALRSKGAFTEHRESQALIGQTKGGKLIMQSSGSGLIVESLLTVAAQAVDGCQDAHVLRSWLSASLQGGEEYYAVFAEKLRARLKAMGEAADTPEDESEEEPDDAELYESDVAHAGDDDEHDAEESVAAASDGALEQSATAPGDAAGAE